MAQRLRSCATNRKVADSIPAGLIGIFHWHKILPIALWPWGRLSLLQKQFPGVFPWSKGGRCVRLTTYHHPVPLSRNLGTFSSWNPLGHSRPVTGLLYLFTVFTTARRLSLSWSTSIQTISSDPSSLKSILILCCPDLEHSDRSNVYWTVHHCDSWRMKDQIDVTCNFISLLMCSTCFGH